MKIAVIVGVVAFSALSLIAICKSVKESDLQMIDSDCYHFEN